MIKVIILKKIQVTMKTFASPFSNHFSLSLNRKKCEGMRTMRKKLNIFMLQLSIYYILEKKIGTNTDIPKEARETVCLCCRKVDAMLIASAKIPELEGSFYGQLPNY